MRRAGLLALMISFLLCTGCGGAGKWEKQLEEQRAALRAAEEISFTAALDADLNDHVFECTLRCVCTEEEMVLTVEEPALAAGVTARVRAGESVLAYDGTELYVGQLNNSALTPLGAVPVLMGALLQGYAGVLYEEQSPAGGLLCAEMYVDETTRALLRFDSATLLPVEGELLCGERTAVRCEMRDFTFR